MEGSRVCPRKVGKKDPAPVGPLRLGHPQKLGSVPLKTRPPSKIGICPPKNMVYSSVLVTHTSYSRTQMSHHQSGRTKSLRRGFPLRRRSPTHRARRRARKDSFHFRNRLQLVCCPRNTHISGTGHQWRPPCAAGPSTSAAAPVPRSTEK
jgi:hypothetical protein